MRQITLAGNTGKSIIMLGLSLNNLIDFCSIEKTVVITDSNVHRLYGELFSIYRTIVIKAGEEHKTLDTVHGIYKKLLEFEFDRSSFILGIGGGVVCDIAGFAASTYLRGLPFAFAPTTLLAQVDASVGGKNGVNFKGYKNLIGTINQPQFVLCDFDVLKTLSAAELRNGFAEVIKHALIGDEALFSTIESAREAALSFDKGTIERIVYDSLKVKTGIVSQDETEKGERIKLNFGHTFGHAFEKTAVIKHGEAVSIGMLMEARLSEVKGLLQKKDVERIGQMLAMFDLPVSFKGNVEAIMDAIRKDKKREDEYIHTVLLDGIGKARIEKVNINEIKEIAYDMC
ncbi:MAG: 3-dehydroquinate synthase [Proteobacteria bacterium]|nr:3-dehydroquinate synthase [Pseudomonadota bacterium]